MSSKGLASKRSAKRKIQIRNYVKGQLGGSPSNPFLDDDPIPRQPSQQNVPDPGGDSEESDEILAPNVNLDDADRFVSSLKISKHKRHKYDKKKFPLPKPITEEEFEEIKEELESLRRASQLSDEEESISDSPL